MEMNPDKRQSGSTELILIAVALVIGLITGWVAIRDSTVAELADPVDACSSNEKVRFLRYFV